MNPAGLKQIFKKRTVIVGIGNVLKADDGLGPQLINNLKGKVRSLCIDAGSAPENFGGKIIKENPEVILLVDAVHLGLKPGACELLTKEEILQSGFSTHDLSPKMFIGYLESQTQAQIYLLGIQPQSVKFAEVISPQVQKALTELTNLIKEADHA